jgi:HTH-type transcriptional regulator/antitoxin MqsA
LPNTLICPVCETGHLHLSNYSEVIEYKKHKHNVSGFAHLECAECGAFIANSEVARNNKRLVLAFHKQIDGLLSGREVRLLRKKLALTQAQAAKIFGGGPVAFSKYENDEIAQSEAMDKLLRLAAQSEEAIINLAHLANIEIEYVNSFEAPKEKPSLNISSLFNHLNAVPLKNAPRFVHIETKLLNMEMNQANYYEAQSATG